MEIHNLMEELVASVVEDICSDVSTTESLHYCTDPECRTDAICYVLNRVAPRYVSSGRGIAHLTKDLGSDQQLQIDVVKLAHEGLHRVSAVRRTYYGTTNRKHATGPCFNFPTIKGRLLDGAIFSPVSGVDVILLLDGEPVEMFDTRWSNPYSIPEQTPGTFLFWPAPLPADDDGIERVFSFVLQVDDSRYEPLYHSFTIASESDRVENPVFTLERDFTLPDLYLFSK